MRAHNTKHTAMELGTDKAEATRSVTVSDISGTRSSEGNDERKMTKDQLTAVLIAYFSVFLDFLGMSIVQPILPYYARKFNANAIELGALYSVFNFAALIANYLMGRMSDKYGRRISILYSLFGTCVTYVIIGFAWNYWSLLLFRGICGAFGGSSSIAVCFVFVFFYAHFRWFVLCYLKSHINRVHW